MSLFFSTSSFVKVGYFCPASGLAMSSSKSGFDSTRTRWAETVQACLGSLTTQDCPRPPAGAQQASCLAWIEWCWRPDGMFLEVDAQPKSYLLSFHQHSRLEPISGLFFIHIPGPSPTVQFRSFVFNNIPGYTFIFAIIFLRRDSLQLKLITGSISNT
jgi:hypothetical protein